MLHSIAISLTIKAGLLSILWQNYYLLEREECYERSSEANDAQNAAEVCDKWQGELMHFWHLNDQTTPTTRNKHNYYMHIHTYTLKYFKPQTDSKCPVSVSFGATVNDDASKMTCYLSTGTLKSAHSYIRSAFNACPVPTSDLPICKVRLYSSNSDHKHLPDSRYPWSKQCCGAGGSQTNLAPSISKDSSGTQPNLELSPENRPVEQKIKYTVNFTR